MWLAPENVFQTSDTKGKAREGESLRPGYIFYKKDELFEAKKNGCVFNSREKTERGR